MNKFLLAAVATVALSGCSSAPPGSPVASTAKVPATGTASVQPQPTQGASINMCALMPLGDVQAKSPFQTPLAVATPDVVKAGCTYTAALDAEDPVSVGLVVTEFDSAADAITVLHNDRQTIVDRGLPVNDIAGLADEAFSYGSDEVGVRAVVGARYVEAHFKGEWPDTADDAKVVAGTALVREIISRLP
jgi:Prokaryotic membrane lipoprotein lipid attachment site